MPPATAEPVIPTPVVTAGPGGTPAGGTPEGPPGDGGEPEATPVGGTPGAPATPGPMGTPVGTLWPPGTPQPTPTVLPTPDSGSDYLECVPFAFCGSGYANVWYYVEPPLMWPRKWDCVDASVCAPHTPPAEEDPGPCVPNPPEVICEETYWDYELYVVARIPPHKVQIDPFPRWLVGMGAPMPAPFESGEAGKLILSDSPGYTPAEMCSPNGPGGAAGCWSQAVDWPRRRPDEESQVGDVRDFQIGLRWRRLDVTGGQDLGPFAPICWNFGDRQWNLGQDYGYGPISNVVCGSKEVEHIYETASWGLPANGPRFLPAEEVCPRSQWETGCCEQVPDVWDMPSYQASVNTNWSVEYSTKWDQYEVVADNGKCTCHGGAGADECTGTSGHCIGSDEHWVWESDPVYGWVHHEEEWEAIDLRDFDHPTWYYTSWMATSGGSGPWCAFEYGTGGIPIPVIEAQSVLRDPCVLDDSCPPGYQ